MVRKTILFIKVMLIMQTILSQIIEIEIGSPPDSAPFFSEQESVEDFIIKNIEYSIANLNDTICGKVYIEFTIETNGATSNHKIIKGIRKDIDKAVLEASKLVKFEKPAKLRGTPIKDKYRCSIRIDQNRMENTKVDTIKMN